MLQSLSVWLSNYYSSTMFILWLWLLLNTNRKPHAGSRTYWSAWHWHGNNAGAASDEFCRILHRWYTPDKFSLVNWCYCFSFTVYPNSDFEGNKWFLTMGIEYCDFSIFSNNLLQFFGGFFTVIFLQSYVWSWLRRNHCMVYIYVHKVTATNGKLLYVTCDIMKNMAFVGILCHSF